MIANLFQPIFNMLGISSFLLTPQQLITSMQTLPNWYNVFNPDIFISWLVYVGFAYGAIFVLMVFPFRLFKKLLRVPKRRG